MTTATISATTSLDHAARTAWEAVVIGAGPAGSFAARQLSLAGARTLLVDRKSFPRSKVCGACVNGHALAVLESAGLARLVWSLGARPLRRLQVHSGSGSAAVLLPGGAAVSRRRLDAALVQEAIAAGAMFLPGVSGSVSPPETRRPAGRRVDLKSAGGTQPARSIRARVVLVASGLGAPGPLSTSEFQSRVAARGRIGIGAVVSDASGYDPGTICMALGRSGYAGVVRNEEDALNVAAALDPESVRRDGGPAEAVARLLADAHLPAIASLTGATWTGTVPLTRCTRPLAAERVFLIGDAAGYVEPFTGEGIGWALQSAAAVVPLARAGIASWDFRIAKQWAAVYGRQIARRQRLCRLIAAGLRYPRLSLGVLRALSCSPRLASPLLARISGAPARVKASC